ncbi:hypothetical protein C8R45DRAFT_948654 [Mycena sanguinolenta]|nr:hypothetical protein C8R45DRAFT_948654 [Mycena sanguinolenta]
MLWPRSLFLLLLATLTHANTEITSFDAAHRRTAVTITSAGVLRCTTKPENTADFNNDSRPFARAGQPVGPSPVHRMGRLSVLCVHPARLRSQRPSLCQNAARTSSTSRSTPPARMHVGCSLLPWQSQPVNFNFKLFSLHCTDAQGLRPGRRCPPLGTPRCRGPNYDAQIRRGRCAHTGATMDPQYLSSSRACFWKR